MLNILHGNYDADRAGELHTLIARYPDAVSEPVGKERRTALHEAAWGVPKHETDNTVYAVIRSSFMDELLAVPNIDVNAQDWEGNTPLHVALSCCPQLPSGYTDLIRVDFQDTFMNFVQKDVILGLLKLGADPNIPNNQGKTPIHLAAERGRYSILSTMLSDYGGAPLALDNTRWTPAHYATMYSYQYVLEALNDAIETRANPGRPAPLPEPVPTIEKYAKPAGEE